MHCTTYVKSKRSTITGRHGGYHIANLVNNTDKSHTHIINKHFSSAHPDICAYYFMVFQTIFACFMLGCFDYDEKNYYYATLGSELILISILWTFAQLQAHINRWMKGACLLQSGAQLKPGQSASQPACLPYL